MSRHPRDKANSYSIGMLEQLIKFAIYDLESRRPTKVEDALKHLKEALGHSEVAMRYALTTNDVGEPLVPLPAS